MKPDFNKGLLPAIIQDDYSLQVLMLGYMDEAAFQKTQQEGKVTFFSRSKNRLWTKGESSGNFLIVKSMQLDCDDDSILIRVQAQGPTCHTGSKSCFNQTGNERFLYELEQIIAERLESQASNSYTVQLAQKGVNKIAQKVGEEAVELVIEAIADNQHMFKEEAADLLFHFLLLLRSKEISLAQIEEVLYNRHQKE
jgi:phosphoribosyl-ATP pyrophosphohydrolase/phosphoribosyl-AMP cyclohydrolase